MFWHLLELQKLVQCNLLCHLWRLQPTVPPLILGWTNMMRIVPRDTVARKLHRCRDVCRGGCRYCIQNHANSAPWHRKDATGVIFLCRCIIATERIIATGHNMSFRNARQLCLETLETLETLIRILITGNGLH